ncbi:MAG: TolC family protein [Candidatus Kapabacteria bacterium]|nr:TolC family protein [Candidatus Kapabacteria bacterium]
MKNIFIIIAMFVVANSALAQRIDDVVSEILSNNKQIKAHTEYVNTLNFEYRINNLPPNPSISYTYMMNSADTDLNRTELIVGQKFDFPTTYFIKSDIARKRGELGRFEIDTYRKSIILIAKDALIDYVFLDKMQSRLSERMQIAQNLVDIAQKRHESGDIGITDYNKARTELLKLRNAQSINDSEIEFVQNRIIELNGGNPIDLSGLRLNDEQSLPTFDELYEQIYSQSSELQSLQRENDLTESKVKLANHQWLPGFELGYRQDNEQGTRYSGIHFGLSIPIFENVNKVSKAKSELQLVSLKINSYQNELKLNKKRLFDKVIATRNAINEYTEILSTSNNATLLGKSLESGNISMLEYYFELGYYYEIEDSLIRLQSVYEKALAELTLELFE